MADTVQDSAETGTTQPFRYPVRAMLTLTSIFVVVHATYYALGVTFNRGTLVGIMHFLDAELLRTALLESLWYLHIQPPLMNLFAGLILKLTPDSAWLFQAIFLVLGLILYLSIYLLQLRLRVNPKLAAVLSTLFMASPSFLLWENFLLYTFPCAALLALSAVLLCHFLERRSSWAVAGFFVSLMLICGMRSMFHLGYMILVFGVVLYLGKGMRLRVLAIGILPVLLVFSFYFKNFIVFGEFNTSTFFEKNLWIMTAGNLGDRKNTLIAEGKLSELSWINRWASLDAYPPEYQVVPEPFDQIPVLTMKHKTNGEVNYNHYGNIAISDVYGEDAKYVLRHYPTAVLNAMKLSWYRFFISSSALPVSPGNKENIPTLITLYDYVFYGKFPIDLAPHSRLVKDAQHQPYLILLFGLPLVFLYALYRALFNPAKGRSLDSVQRPLVFFILLNVSMVAVLGCTFDFHETARYRFITDGLSVVLLGFLITAVTERNKKIF
jgi:hypothetical protein